MDDDLRNRFRAVRRDYTAPAPRPPRPASQANPHQSAPSQPMFPAAQTYNSTPAVPKPTSRHHQPRHQEHIPAQAVHQTKSKAHKKSKKLLKILVLLVLVSAAAGAGGLWAYPKYFTPNPFPASIQSNVKIALFYPKKLPASYTVDQSSMNLNNGVVTFRAVNGQKHIVFTLQSVLPGFDFATFYKTQMTSPKIYSTAYGEATIGTNDKRQLGSLAQNNTWLILSTNSSDVSASDMALIMTNLKKF